MIFKLTPQKEEFFAEAPWIFRSETTLDISASDMWKILEDDGAWKYWHPDVAKIDWQDANRELNSERIVTLKDPLFMMLLAGPLKLHEVFDVYEKDKKLGMYVKALNRPSFMTYTSFREEFLLEAVDEKQCKVTRTVAVAPAFLSKYVLGCIIYPHTKHALTKKVPEQLVKAISEGKLPRIPET
jgi:hypothetical protein